MHWARKNFLNLVPAEQVEGLYGRLDYYRDVTDPFSNALLAQYDARFPGSAMFTAGSARSGMYRGLKLWEAAVNEAGSLRQDDVVAALDHASIADGPGGPASMVSGQHHLRLNMYIAQAQRGTFKVVKNPGRSSRRRTRSRSSCRGRSDAASTAQHQPSSTGTTVAS